MSPRLLFGTTDLDVDSDDEHRHKREMTATNAASAACACSAAGPNTSNSSTSIPTPVAQLPDLTVAASYSPSTFTVNDGNDQMTITASNSGCVKSRICRSPVS